MNKEEIDNLENYLKNELLKIEPTIPVTCSITSLKIEPTIPVTCSITSLKKVPQLDELLRENKMLRIHLKEKDKIIDEIEKRCNQEISVAAVQYERHKTSNTWQYIIAHKKILEILERGIM